MLFLSILFCAIFKRKLSNDDYRLIALTRSNSPSIRPDLAVVLDGIIGTQDRGLPIGGTAC